MDTVSFEVVGNERTTQHRYARNFQLQLQLGCEASAHTRWQAGEHLTSRRYGVGSARARNGCMVIRLRASYVRNECDEQNKNKTKTKQNEYIRTRHARARQMGAWGCEGVPTRLLANREPRRRQNVSYGASFEPFWAKYDDI